MTTSCYLHIPFCKSKCPYCDFYSVPEGNHGAPGRRALQEAYINRCVELLRAQDAVWQTAYIGGGTPSALEPALLAQLFGAIDCAGEFTIECNPTSVTEEFCEAIMAGGVNRVSLGVQSAIPAERRALGRTGGMDAVERAIALLQSAGIKNLSLDVMLGIPRQTDESLTETLVFCAAYAQHISAYLLKIEPGTRFYTETPAGLPNEDAQAALYLHACEWLESHGFAQYEISNFAKRDRESRHNLNYWRCGEYSAIGPAAHGFTNGRRWHYDRDITAFLQGGAVIDDGPGGDYEERAMLALRLNEGFAQPNAHMLEQAKLLADYVIVDNGRVRLTRSGYLLSNTIIAKLLY